MCYAQVVELSAGIEEEGPEEEEKTDDRNNLSSHNSGAMTNEPHSLMAVKRRQQPVERLKEALSSKKAFQKCYLVSKDF